MNWILQHPLENIKDEESNGNFYMLCYVSYFNTDLLKPVLSPKY